MSTTSTFQVEFIIDIPEGAPPCCCGGTPALDCDCATLPDTIWAIVNRNSDDSYFLDCAEGAFDGELFELTEVSESPRAWEGTTPSGYLVHLECYEVIDIGGGITQVGFHLWVCDSIDETNYATQCEGTWSDPFLDTYALYPYGFIINSCDCAEGAAIDFLFYISSPV